ncbi:sialate O-acetylesterase [Paenibacillus sp. HB172176]|uniref:sialate O-acetylesterase n=1 Tax=Paenibacillus sp. HB172176 TaxID=2493690 RepID=UPI00143A881B|nr:sialate O-acetylesterase [Paenibacillus sp. HB172176]
MDLRVLEVEAYRVYQRNQDNQCDIPFGLEGSEPVEGTVEARLFSSVYSTAWQVMGKSEGQCFQGIFPNVPVGSFGMEFRVTSEDHVASISVSPVFVGDLWLLAGQSNMEGCGKEIDVETPVEGVSCFYMGDRWGLAEEPLCWLQEAIDPVHWKVPAEKVAEEAKRLRRERTNGAGLALTFAKEILRETGVPIGLIMAPHGGTNMLKWDPAKRNEGGNSFYGAMIRKVSKLGGRIKGCLWYQGESDANESDAPFYLERTIAFMNSLRQDAGDDKLPIIYAQLAVHYSPEDPRWWNLVQQNQLSLEEQMEDMWMVPTIDASMSDGIHPDAKSLQNIGRRMAWQAIHHVYGRPSVLPGPRLSATEWNEQRTELILSFNGINFRLNAVRQVFGFRVEVDGCNQAFTGRVSEDAQKVILSFEEPVIGETSLQHGYGRNPFVNIRDQFGIPLPVFGPIPV